MPISDLSFPLILLQAGCAVCCYRLARRKGRAAPFWAVAGLITGVMAVMALWLAAPLGPPGGNQRRRAESGAIAIGIGLAVLVAVYLAMQVSAPADRGGMRWGFLPGAALVILGLLSYRAPDADRTRNASAPRRERA